MLNWQICTFQQLSTLQLYQLLKLRVDIFVVEQNCPYPELDNKDIQEGVYHLIGYVEEEGNSKQEKGEIVACARLMKPGIHYPNVSIGRVATKASHRGQGLGHELITQAVAQCRTIWPDATIDIGAQQYLCDFYKKHGFTAISDSYLEDNIPHIDMRLYPSDLKMPDSKK